MTCNFTNNFSVNSNSVEYFRCDNHCSGVLQRLRSYCDLCDVVLIAGDSGKRISAHRLVLIAASDYFAALLNGTCRESQQREITLREVDGDAVEQLVNYCYTGCLELRGDTIENILVTADYMQFKDVIEGCCGFFQRNLQLSNCLDVALIAGELNLEGLLKACREIIYTHFEEISNWPKFQLLSIDVVTQLLASDELHAPSEEFVFEVLINWIECEPETRWQYFTQLLPLIRFPLLTPTFFTEVVEPFCNTTESKNCVLNGLQMRKPRNYKSKRVMKQYMSTYILQRVAENHIKFVSYNFRTNKWSLWSTPINYQNFGFTLIDDNLILVGGYANGSELNTVQSLNLHTMNLTKMAPLITSRSSPCLAVLNGFIYAVGGRRVNENLNTVERWHPVRRRWSYVASMKKALSCIAVAVMNDRLYCTGLAMNDNVTSFECYDPVEDVWISKATIVRRFIMTYLVPRKDYLLSIAGNYTSESIKRYDQLEDTWTTVASARTFPDTNKCASLGPDLFVHNRDGFFAGTFADDCDSITLQEIPAPKAKLYCYLRSGIGIPYEVNPPEKWIDAVEI